MPFAVDEECRDKTATPCENASSSSSSSFSFFSFARREFLHSQFGSPPRSPFPCPTTNLSLVGQPREEARDRGRESGRDRVSPGGGPVDSRRAPAHVRDHVHLLCRWDCGTARGRWPGLAFRSAYRSRPKKSLTAAKLPRSGRMKDRRRIRASPRRIEKAATRSCCTVRLLSCRAIRVRITLVAAQSHPFSHHEGGRMLVVAAVLDNRNDTYAVFFFITVSLLLCTWRSTLRGTSRLVNYTLVLDTGWAVRGRKATELRMWVATGRDMGGNLAAVRVRSRSR
ncbi:hypothetical protein LY76DRAFT_656614 [Colletotrichum caudatum]|nr:hypothetical protein LY76DRAFT_656614 [Colletotrichum caudatum]